MTAVERLVADFTLEIPLVSVEAQHVLLQVAFSLDSLSADVALEGATVIVRWLMCGQGTLRGKALPTDGAYVFIFFFMFRQHVISQAALSIKHSITDGTLVLDIFCV